jgi:hypothetical protein
MSEEKCPNGHDEPETAVTENLLTYADLLQLDWVLEDKIGEWEWRDDGLENLIKKGRATLGRIREMIRKDDLADLEKGGES